MGPTLNTNQGSPLYRRILIFGWLLPPVAFVVVLLHQVIEHTLLRPLPVEFHFLTQLFFYGVIGPALTWVTLHWIARRVRERDEADAQLKVLYNASSRSAEASDLDSLLDLAIEMPGWVTNETASTLLLRHSPSSPWFVARSRGLDESERDRLQSALSSDGTDMACDDCALARNGNDPVAGCLLSKIDRTESVFCLPVSTQRPPTALLSVFSGTGSPISPTQQATLRSMASGIAVAMDNTRLRAEQVEMLLRVENAITAPGQETSALRVMLDEISVNARATASAIYVGNNGTGRATRVSSWPSDELAATLDAMADAFMASEREEANSGLENGDYAELIPLVVSGSVDGVLILRTARPLTRSQRAFVRTAGGVAALVLDNRRLFAELESQALIDERTRLAREVHDGLAQSLGFLNFKIQQIDRLQANDKWPEARAALGELRDGSQDMYTQLRLEIQNLRWPVLSDDDASFTERLTTFLSDFETRTGLNINTAIDPELMLPPRHEVQLFRITQEALTNVHKHAQATEATVSLAVVGDFISLEVSDNGIGFDESSDIPEGRFGLNILRERVDAMDGTARFERIEPSGTSLRVNIPIELVAAS